MQYAVETNKTSAVVEEKAGLQRLTRVWSLIAVGALSQPLAREYRPDPARADMPGRQARRDVTQ